MGRHGAGCGAVGCHCVIGDVAIDRGFTFRQLGGEDRVHAAIDAGARTGGRGAARNELRGLQFVLTLLVLNGFGDFRRDLIGWALRRRVECQRAGRAGRLLRIEDILLFAEVDLRLLLGDFEVVVAFLDHLPERHVRIIAMARHVLRGHAERIGLHLKCVLAAEKGLAAEGVDLGDLFVGHRVTAARRAIAMHHQLRTGAAPRPVIGVRIAHVERQVITRVRVHLRRGDRIEAFRSLPVAFLHLRAEIAGPAADRIGFQQCELAVAILLPDFKLGFLLEQADKHRRGLVHVLGFDVGEQLVGNRTVGLRAWRELFAVAAGQQNARSKRSRSGKRANGRAVDQCKTSHAKALRQTGNPHVPARPKTRPQRPVANRLPAKWRTIGSRKTLCV